MAKVDTLVDPFTATSLNTGLWAQFTGGSATMGYSSSGAQVNYPSSSTSSTDGDLTSNTTYDLTTSHVLMKVTQAPVSGATSTDTELRIFTDASNWFRIVKEGSQLIFQRRKAGTNGTIASVTYNGTTHLWWKIEASGTIITWYTSPDGLTWTSQGTFTHGMTITAMKVLIAGTCFATQSSPGTFQFSQLNNPPVAQSLTAPFVSASNVLLSMALIMILAVAFIASTNALYAPTVTLGTVTLSPPLINSSNTVSVPVLTPGAVTLSPPQIASTNSVYTGQLNLTMALGFIATSNVVSPPTLTLGVYTLQMPVIAAANVLYTPNITLGGVTLTNPFLASTNQLFAPFVFRSQNPIELLLLGVG